MFHKEILPLRSHAGRVASIASGIVGGISDNERLKLLQSVDTAFDALSHNCGRVRKSFKYSYTFTQTAWISVTPDTDEPRTDLDFLQDERVLADPIFSELLARFSAGNPDYGLLQLISLLVLRDLDNGDLWSIRRIQPIFDQLLAEDSRQQSLSCGQRKRGMEKSNDKRRAQFGDVVAYVKDNGRALLDAGKSKANSIAILSKRYPRSLDSKYPSKRTIERAFAKAFPKS
jgi:hypothetical protein